MRRPSELKNLHGIKAGNIEPSRKHVIDGKGLLVFDDLFTAGFIEELSLFVLRQKYEARPSFDNELSAAMDRRFLRSLPTIPVLLDSLIASFYAGISRKRSPQLLSHGYAAAFKFGDSTMVHQDIECDDCLTYLYYGNVSWEGQWGGETVFYDSRMDACAAVTPKPGRLILFNAGLYHRAGVPNGHCPTFRYGLSVFYRCRKQLGK
jgi:SM-20-related protein